MQDTGNPVSPLPKSQPAEPDPRSNAKSDGIGIGPIAGVVAAGVLILLAGVAGLLLVMRRKRRDANTASLRNALNQSPQDSQSRNEATPHNSNKPAADALSIHSSSGNEGTCAGAAATQSSMHATDASTVSGTSNRPGQQSCRLNTSPMPPSQFTEGGTGTGFTALTAAASELGDLYAASYPTRGGCTTFAETSVVGGPQEAPGPGATSQSKQEHVQYQVDSLGGKEVLDGLIVLQGLRTRLLGGVCSFRFICTSKFFLKWNV